MRLLRLRVQLDGGGPGLPRPGCAREGHALRRDARDRTEVERLQAYSGDRDLGLHALLLLSGALPQGSRSARRDREAGRAGDGEGNRLGHGGEACALVRDLATTTCLRETELVPKTQGVVSALQEIGFAMQLFKRGKVPPRYPRTWPRTSASTRAVRHREDAGPGRRGRHRAGREAAQPPRIRGRAGNEPYGEGSFPRPQPLPGDTPEAETAPTTS